MSNHVSDHAARAETSQPSSWAVGGTVFAAVTMIVLGVWWLVVGVAALVDDEFFVLTPTYVFRLDLTQWGWTHVVVGAVLLASGIGLFSGALWSRVVAVIVAALAAIVGFAWLPWYPLASVLMIAVSILVIWSLTAHGRDITRA